MVQLGFTTLAIIVAAVALCSKNNQQQPKPMIDQENDDEGEELPYCPNNSNEHLRSLELADDDDDSHMESRA